MLQLGKTQSLTVARLTSVGAYLTDGSEDILLPKKYVEPNVDLGQSIEVFVYLDSEDRPVATTQTPKAEADSFALLRCVGVSNIGAFLDFGLEKDLLVPFREQLSPMREEQSYVVRVFVDPVSNRLVGSSKIRRFVKPPPDTLAPGTEMDFLVADLRARAAIGIADGLYEAAVLDDEMPRPLKVGQKLRAWIKRRNEDGLLLALRPLGRRAEMTEADSLVERLRTNNGFLPYNDDSPAEEIRRKLGMSKSAFKRIVGHLLKDGRIDIESYGIRLRQ